MLLHMLWWQCHALVGLHLQQSLRNETDYAIMLHGFTERRNRYGLGQVSIHSAASLLNSGHGAVASLIVTGHQPVQSVDWKNHTRAVSCPGSEVPATPARGSSIAVGAKTAFAEAEPGGPWVTIGDWLRGAYPLKGCLLRAIPTIH